MNLGKIQSIAPLICLRLKPSRKHRSSDFIVEVVIFIETKKILAVY
jgi:hypothetical protein